MIFFIVTGRVSSTPARSVITDECKKIQRANVLEQDMDSNCYSTPRGQ